MLKEQDGQYDRRYYIGNVSAVALASNSGCSYDQVSQTGNNKNKGQKQTP